MRKFLVVTIPIVTLTLFVLIMISGNYLKRPIGQNDDVPQLIQTVIEDVDHENWEIADQNREKLNNAWNKVVRRVQFSSERDEINALGASLARLRGAIMAEDKVSALLELNEAYEHWDALGR